MPSEPRNEDVLATLLGFLARFSTKSGPVRAETDLAADLNLDSVSMMELLVEIEDHYDVGLPLNMMADISTVQDLADRIAQIVETSR